MNCLECGKEMEQGVAECINPGFEQWYQFTLDSEKSKKGLKGLFTKKTIDIPAYGGETRSWYCSECGKVLLWLDGKE